MRGLFGVGSSSGSAREKGAEKSTRHSSGWREMLKFLQRGESLRVLDIGPTSSTNINFLTGLGHSIYMANLVEEAARPEWKQTGEDGLPSFRTTDFLESNLSFSGRTFDVVLLWDTTDYLPAALLAPLLHRLREAMAPGGLMLALFHGKAQQSSGSTAVSDTGFFRYHLTATEAIEMQRAGSYPLLNSHTNRQIETLLHDFNNFRFFLAKDNLREVLASR